MHPKPFAHNSSKKPAPGEDLQLVTQAVIDLHVARRNLLIYPLSHEQVKRSIAKAFKSIGQVAGPPPGITLIVMKDGIGVGDQTLDTKSSILADFASVLKHYQIATVTIQEGLHIKELARFLQLICLDRGKIIDKGGVAAVVDGLDFKSIRLQAVDYSQLQVTEEKEIHRVSGEPEERGSIWQQFVSNFTAGHPTSDGELPSSMNPGQMARILNQKGLDVGQVVQHYQSTIAGATEAGSDEESLTNELAAFQEMIKGLDDGLREQFLSATFDHCDQLPSASDAAYLCEGLGGDLIIEMLSQASSKGKKISPSLISFINKMGQADGLSSQQGMGADVAGAEGFTSQSVESLLAHENYDTYVDSDYEKLLGQLGGGTLASDRKEAGLTLSQQVTGELTDEMIHSHVAHSITRLMTHSTNISEYRDWAKQLTYLLDDLLEHGAYDYLTKVMAFVRREKKKAGDQERAEIAGLVLDRFSDPQFVAKAIESAQAAARDDDPKALAFFMELGEPVVIEIFDGLDPEQTFLEQNMLIQILKNLKSLTAKEALERIKDPRPDYVRRMVRIIRKMGDSRSAEQIRKLMDHEDIDVRMEALATLLAFKNKWGLVRLRDLLSAPQGDAFEKAAGLAGRYRLRAMVPQLVAVASQRGDVEPREVAIRALGKIGDPAAIPVLSKIARKRWILIKAQTRHLKRTVYETLGGYPIDAVHGLLRYGLKQKDAVVRESCENLLRKGGEKNTGEDAASEGYRLAKDASTKGDEGA